MEDTVAMDTEGPVTTGRIVCDQCGQEHDATFSHEGTFGEGPIYAVVCTVDHLTDYYTTERLI